MSLVRECLSARFALGIIGAVVAAQLFAACGSGADSSNGAEQGPLPEDSLAAAMLLQVSDLPTGWAVTSPDEEDDDDPFGECPEYEAQTGRAESEIFSKGGFAELSHAVGVFATEADARQAMQTFQRRGDCFARNVNDGAFDNADAEFGDASIGLVSFPTFGDESETWRMSFVGEADDQSVDFFFDIVVIRTGRFVSAVQAVDFLSPFNTTTLQDVAAVASEKMKVSE